MSEEIREDYRRFILRKHLFIIACILVAIASVGVGCTVGTRSIGFADVYRNIWEHMLGAEYAWGTDEWFDDYIIWNVRLPRAFVGAIAGAALALGGLSMQGILKNPLADTYSTGVSSGACLGAVLAIVLGASIADDQYAVVMNAFVFSLIPVAVMVLVSNRMSGNPASILLAGAAVSMFFGSFTTLILLTSNSDDMQAAFLWQVGSLENMSWSDVPLMLSLTVAGFIFIQLTSRRMNAMNSGDEYATSVGIDVGRYRLACLVVVSLMTAGVVSFTGIIGFIGMVSPHIIRMVLGADNRYLAVPSMAFGAALLVASDSLSRILLYPDELPAGVVVAFIGAPVFLYLAIRMRRNAYGG